MLRTGKRNWGLNLLVRASGRESVHFVLVCENQTFDTDFFFKFLAGRISFLTCPIVLLWWHQLYERFEPVFVKNTALLPEKNSNSFGPQDSRPITPAPHAGYLQMLLHLSGAKPEMLTLVTQFHNLSNYDFLSDLFLAFFPCLFGFQRTHSSF